MSAKKTVSLSELPGRRKSFQLSAIFRRTGIASDKAGRGRLTAKNFVAEVRVEPDGLITFRANIDPLLEPLSALQNSADFTGNARFTITDTGCQMAAETRVNGAAHLPDSIKEIHRTFGAVLARRKSRRRCRGKAGVDPAAAIKRTIKEAGWSEQQIVVLEHGWEMQPRLEGQTIPVELRTAGDGVQISRGVLSSLPDDAVVGAVAHQALLFNGRLRFVRLSVVEGRLVAETRLRAGLIDAAWLDFAARAVASAAKGVTPTLKLLAHETEVAVHYSELLMKS